MLFANDPAAGTAGNQRPKGKPSYAILYITLANDQADLRFYQKRNYYRSQRQAMPYYILLSPTTKRICAFIKSATTIDYDAKQVSPAE